MLSNPLLSGLKSVFARSPRGRTRRGPRLNRHNTRRIRLEPLEDRLCLSIYWDGGGDGTSWGDPLNWDLDRLPGLADDVVIDVAGEITVTHALGEASVNSVLCKETLELTGGSLTITDPSEIHSLTLGGASLYSDDLSVTNLYWTGASTMGGSGTTTVAADGVLEKSGYGGTLQDRTLDNYGDAIWTAGGFLLDGGVLKNLNTFEASVDEGSKIAIDGNGEFYNYGTFTKTGLGTVQIDTAFHNRRRETPNSGTVLLQSGYLSFTDGGTSDGNFLAGPATGMGFADITVLEANSRLVSEGNVGFWALPGPITVAGEYDIAGLTKVRRGTVSFTGNVENVGESLEVGPEEYVTVADFGSSALNVSDLTMGRHGTLFSGDVNTTNIYWDGSGMYGGSVMGGPGTTTVAAGGTLEITGALGARTLQGRTLNNYGDATLARSLNLDDAVLNNYGSLEVDGAEDLTPGLRGNGQFYNYGTVTKTGPRSLHLHASFNNVRTVPDGGIVHIEEGGLAFIGGGTSDGDFFAKPGTTLAFGGIAVLQPTSRIISEGTVGFGWGVVDSPDRVTIAGEYVAGHTGVSYGIATFTGSLVDVGESLWVRANADFGSKSISTTTLTMASGIGGTLLSGDVHTTDLFWTGASTMGGSGTTTVAADGTLRLTADINSSNKNHTLQGRTLENRGTATWELGNIVLDNAVLNNIGVFEVQVSEGVEVAIAGIGEFNNLGQFNKPAGTVRTEIWTAFNNWGVVDLQSDWLAFKGSAAYTQIEGETILNGGSISSDSPLQIQGGLLIGSGAVSANLNNAGQLSPGYPSPAAGYLDLTGNYTQGAAGIFDVEIGGLAAKTEFDQLDVIGDVNVAGALNVSLIEDFVPEFGQTFTIINNDGADEVNGIFDGLFEGAIIPIGSDEFQISYAGGDGNDVVLTYFTNQPPAAAIDGPTDGVRGQTLWFTFSASDAPADEAAGFIFNIAWGDGALQTISREPNNGAGTTVDHHYHENGSYTLRVTAIDQHGAVSDEAVHSVAITTVAVQPAPCDPTKTSLVVGGTDGNDHIVFHPGEVEGDVVVVLNGVSLGPFQPTGRLVAFGQGGDDTIQVSGSLSLSAWLYGDEGNDRVKGGAGHDLLFGGLGDDLLVGGSGRDLLIGGFGADRIVGNSDDDILIAGRTAYDAHDAALCAIMAEWTSERDYQTRVANLRDGSGSPEEERDNGAYFLDTEGPDATVFDDAARDVLTGSAGLDWFMFNTEQDKATDLNDEEFDDVRDFIFAEV